MRWLAILAFMISGSARADQAPSWWRLPQEGKGCFFQEAFEAEKITCGSQRVERWTCVTEAEGKFESAKADHFLLMGEYGSDVASGCSPTFMVKQVIKQKKSQ